jgi:enoyl-[acyl-carrier protein] reductase I
VVSGAGGEVTAALLSEKRGLVLGVSSRDSVGYHAAQGLREAGAEVAVSLRSRAAPFAVELEESGFVVVELDAFDESSLERAIGEVGQGFGRLDFLVHTLVHVPSGALERPLTALTSRELSDAMEIGVRSLLSAVRHARPWLERSSTPRVVALLSGGADFAMPSYHVVGLVKAALAAAIRYLAAELGPAGILCNAVNFSILETHAAKRVIGDERTAHTRDYLAKRSMTRRALSYADVTRAITFLTSPLCSNLTGEALLVDGGFSKSYF